MSKVNLKVSLKSKNEDYSFEGKGIKKDNEILYKEKKILNIIDFGELISLERRSDYYLRIEFKKNKKLPGVYLNDFGNMIIDTYTKQLVRKNNKLKIVYDLYLNKHLIDTFEYNLEYSIDR